MVWSRTLFDGAPFESEPPNRSRNTSSAKDKEDGPLDRLKNLEEKIASVVDRVKALKEEKTVLEKRISELEAMLDEKNQEIESLKSEKTSIKSQVDELLEELETLEI
jgi:chromosome segregation ATPase